MTAIVLLPYYIFVLVIALAPRLLDHPLASGSVVTVGWPIAAFLVVGAWVTTGIYIRRANGEFDSMNEEVLNEAIK